MGQELFTIGHSTHPLLRFLDFLTEYKISAICDVRSQPYSRQSPQFNREPFQKELSRINVSYVFLGEELGARASDLSCYKVGKVQYDRIAATPFFLRGITRLKRGIKDYRVALMCAEKDPLCCHRTILICRHIKTLDLSIRHILYSGQIELHEASEKRLLKLVGIDQWNLFQSFSDPLERAYDLQGQRIAYTRPLTGISEDLHEHEK